MRLWRKCRQVPRIYGQSRGIEVSRIKSRRHGNTSTQNKKELQRLTGKLVALGRFIARFIDELRPFFLAIWKAAHKDGRTVVKVLSKNQALSYATTHLKQPHPEGEAIHVLGVSEWAIAVYSDALHQRSETLLC
ncbi:hypothetical protein AAG906_001387 [Vitis piasezkii]